jgi:hypothetical protein
VFTTDKVRMASAAKASSQRWTMVAAICAAVAASVWMSVEFAAKGYSPVGQVVRVVLPLLLGVGALVQIRWARTVFIILSAFWAVAIVVPAILAVNAPGNERVVRGLIAFVYAISATLAWISTGRARSFAPNT